MACIERIKIEGEDVIPAQVEGLVDVFAANNFVFSKARWVEDNEVSACKICSNKFNQLRRKHHCRQCGRVLCSKCCSQKVPLPQLGLPDPERVCEVCKPVTECITKSRSSHQSFQLEAVQGLTELVMDSAGMKKVIELGGLQTLVFLSKQENEQIR
ncbi:arrestin domain-containing protein A-like, partial [Lingula anatina]|uniref:Arrestin domain-containing protein A-like n=1 Tax=Lingula anatina TaxID=7574 RepID=A0A1S3I9D4_LINAN